MFTGLVETVGTLAGKTHRGPGYRLDVVGTLGELVLGESIAVSGVCLSVVEVRPDGFSADVSAETASRTTLGDVAVGGLVNLERALRAGDRLGGHLVSGHVDGVAVVARVASTGEALSVTVRPPQELMAYLAEKGSVTLDGVSLTINRTARDTIDLMLVPHTVAVTNLRGLREGRRLNVEVDLLARYVVHHLRTAGGAPASSADERLVDVLDGAGFLSK